MAQFCGILETEIVSPWLWFWRVRQFYCPNDPESLDAKLQRRFRRKCSIPVRQLGTPSVR